jgi:hypothetical protein
MAFTSYTTLKSTIADYLARSDLTTQIPDFIRLAEERLRRDLRIRQMLKVATSAMVVDDSTVSLPTDFIAMKDLHLSTTPATSIKFLTTNTFFKVARTTTKGKPVFYTLLGSEFQFAPIPDSAYTLQIVYYAKPDLLSDTTASNIFLETCPDLLLYGALGEAEPYLMNDERLNTWASLYQRGLTSLSKSDDDGEYPSSPMSITLTKR